jgi:RNA polymerase sigma factor (sigma-70 family)
VTIEETSAERLMLVEPVVRRVLAARVRPDVVDDLVQDTVERLVPVAERLPIGELTPYAVVAAQNAARSRLRRDARARTRPGEALGRDWTDEPDSRLVAAEEAAAVAQAMSTLPVEDQDLLRDHHLEGEEVASIARRSGRTDMAVRVHLARARAKLRVAYSVVDAGTPLTSERCGRVLEALAMGDRRTQKRLGVHEHVKGCPTCAALVEPVTGTRRPAVGLFAVVLLWWRTASTGVHSAVVATAVAAGAAAVVVATHGSPPAPEQATPPPPPPTSIATTTAPPSTTAPPPTTVPARIQTAGDPLPSTPAGLAGRAGPVTARSVPVLAVPADEGFWIAADDGGQLWVALAAGSGESPITIRAGATVSFEGTVVADDPGYAKRVGLTASSGADRLTQQAHHLEVPINAIRLG